MSSSGYLLILHPLMITLVDTCCHECLLVPPTTGHHLWSTRGSDLFTNYNLQHQVEFPNTNHNLYLSQDYQTRQLIPRRVIFRNPSVRAMISHTPLDFQNHQATTSSGHVLPQNKLQLVKSPQQVIASKPQSKVV